MAHHWGETYFHFLIESLPRIGVMLDILRVNVDVKVGDAWGFSAAMPMHSDSCYPHEPDAFSREDDGEM